jgi:hypothetical protein
VEESTVAKAEPAVEGLAAPPAGAEEAMSATSGPLSDTLESTGARTEPATTAHAPAATDTAA